MTALQIRDVGSILGEIERKIGRNDGVRFDRSQLTLMGGSIVFDAILSIVDAFYSNTRSAFILFTNSKEMPPKCLYLSRTAGLHLYYFIMN